jgi:hypothetical protein
MRFLGWVLRMYGTLKEGVVHNPEHQFSQIISELRIDKIWFRAHQVIIDAEYEEFNTCRIF